jgi:hypothetical protein
MPRAKAKKSQTNGSRFLSFRAKNMTQIRGNKKAKKNCENITTFQKLKVFYDQKKNK